MNLLHTLTLSAPYLPAALMLLVLIAPRIVTLSTNGQWRLFSVFSALALLAALLAAGVAQAHPTLAAWLRVTPLGLVLAVLVQLLGTVIGHFSARYLHGEPGQQRYVMALAGVLTAVHVLLLANHWLVLIAAWALVGAALQHLLCFYPDRPFALLAAHKKRMADRLADLFLLLAAGLAWSATGSATFTDMWAHLARDGMSLSLHLSAVMLVLAVVLRTALLPVHGWLIQVMEAPTPVSALLHAGVVNLGGFVLISFAPLLDHSAPARWLLLAFGLGTAVLAGMVMLTRISIKVRLAWSTVAQMGFMLLECSLGLYTLAALHLLGHSLYKAHAFLSASTAVRDTRLAMLHGAQTSTPLSLWLAPLGAVVVVLTLQQTLQPAAWPWWWSVLLGLAWAPLLWQVAGQGMRQVLMQTFAGVGLIGVLTSAALLLHAAPLGLYDSPHQAQGMVALLGMGALYLLLLALQSKPQVLSAWRRASYAGFYLDEFYTRLALKWWPARWTPASSQTDVSWPAAHPPAARVH